MNKTIFFGDSNVNVFKYLENYGARIVKFKGSPIKGIVNKNEHYVRIVSEINRFKPESIFLIFGVVDMNFYYYFKKYRENKQNVYDDIKSYVKEYVNLVSELNVKNKYIIGILPSPIKSKNFSISLKAYGILTEEEIKKIPEDDLLMESRNKRIGEINYILKTECEKYNINFCNIFDYICRDYKLIKLFSLGKYGKYNIHHKYEYLFLIFINTCLSFTIKGKNHNKIVDDLENEFDSYIRERIFNYEHLTKDEQTKLYDRTKFDKKKILEFIEKIKK